MKKAYKILIGTSVIAAVLSASFFIFIYFSITYNFDGNGTTQIDPLESEHAFVYGTLSLTEKIDGNRSGMTVHNISIKVDYVEAKKFRKLYAPNIIKKNMYKLLTWENLKINILDDNGKGSYVGIGQISEKFKSKYLNTKIKIAGRIYALCYQTYYLNPSSEKKPSTAFPCWVGSQHHISLPGYYYNKKIEQTK